MEMYPDIFGYTDAAITGTGAFLSTVIIVYFVVFLLSYAYSILVYILQSLGLYTIAMRRGIRRPWLAWVPFGIHWILGSIADQYQYVAKGKVKNRRKVLLGLMIALLVLMLALFGAALALMVTAIGSEFNMSYDESQMILPGILMLVAYLAMMVISVIITVYEYVCYYDLFQSCNPNNGVTFLVLGIFFPFLLPFFVFALRKKDLGMPPRKPAAPAPVFQPTVEAIAEPVIAEPVAEPVVAEPVAEPDDFVEE